MAEAKLNLVQKLAKIRAICDVVQKNKKGYNYSYADLAEILAKVTAAQEKYGVMLIPMIVPGTSRVSQNVVVNTKTDKTGRTYDQTVTEILFSADMIYRWVNVDDPDDFMEIPWSVTGSQSDPSQAMGSGLTYTERQFLTNFFQIANVEYDVDAYRSKQKAVAEAEDISIANEIIDQFDLELKKYISDNPEKTEDTKRLVSKYVKNSNYKTIKNPELAAKLLGEFREKFMKAEEE